MKTPVRSSLEPLEARIAPATVSLVSGIVTYTAGAGVANNVSIGIAGANYALTDTAENITLDASTNGGGFSGDGTHTILFPLASGIGFNILLGDGSDNYTLNAGLTHPLTVDGQGGSDK